jgi:uncharacterized membrane protein YedE/YeeE
MAGLTDVTEIMAGAHHLIALLSNGTVRVVGRADEGEATLPSTASQSINRIGAGSYHAFAIRAAPSLPTLSGVGTYATIGQPLSLTLPTGVGAVLGLPTGFTKDGLTIRGTFSQAAFRVLRMAVGNSAGTISALTAIGTPKITASLTIGGLTANYTGSPVSVTVTGKPAAATGTVKVTYTGIDVVYPESTTAPTLAGRYLVKAEIISWFRIQEMFRLQSFHMYGVIGSAVVVGMISVALIKKFNIKTIYGEIIEFHPKAFNKGQVIGGLIFGLGWAITGACPGPLYAQIGAGAPVIIVTLLSAIAGTWLYGFFRDKLPH